MKRKMIAGIALLLCGSVLLQQGFVGAQNTTEKEPEAVSSRLPENHVFKRIDENGKIIIEDTAKLEAETKKEQAARENMAKVKGIGSARDIKYGVVNFKTKSDSGKNTSYTEVGTGYTGYTNGYYAADGAFLGYASNGTKVKFMLSGVVGMVDADEVEILDYEDEDKVQSVNYYICKNGNIYHSITLNIRQPYYTSTAMVGKQQSYMKSNTVYYSYDGHYFYTTYQKMIDDYKANTRKNSINASQPYYNYYQYVSSRTKTSFTASDINGYVKDYLDDLYNTRDTKMYNMGKYFIDYQNTYGAYALSSFGVAVNESAFGTSSIALSKNNLFGHNAVDSDPGLANGYSSPQNSILDHDKYYVNLWYSTPKYSTYHGAFLGDKASGMNVSYASDPYWGESAAHWMWQLDEYVSGKSDAGNKKLVFKDQGAINIRKEATTSSATLYTTPKNGNMAFNILEKVKGEAVSGNSDWYKIQLDTPLNSARTAIDYSGNSYNFSSSYGYVHSSLLSENGYTSDSSGGNDSGNSSTAYKLGDVNNDGKITPADYVKVKNHIMKKSTLSGKALTAADVNKDGKITPADYVKIKNHIMGKSTIKE
ncbi:dockerin type I domain-containing protein [[Clostridium] innocuum]|nr:dockerin type I domain-containing protein [[Clostridium] innocuum]MCR0578481.1 dockerin type I domain-containing protein [[Clostridium] innocuum]